MVFDLDQLPDTSFVSANQSKANGARYKKEEKRYNKYSCC